MERMRDGMRLRCLGLWLNCCLLAGCLGLWLGGFARLGSLARLADTWTGAWGSGSVYLEKVPAFFYFAGTFFDAKPIETHRGSFHCVIWLDAGTFSNRISYRPANKLKWTREQAQGHCPVCLYSDGQHWFRSQFSEFPATTVFVFILQKLHSYMIEVPP